MAGHVFYNLDVPELNERDDWTLTIVLLGITALFTVAFLWQGFIFLRDLYREKCGQTSTVEPLQLQQASAAVCVAERIIITFL